MTDLPCTEGTALGVDFYVRRVKPKGVPSTKGPLPRIDAHFALTEYPQFLARLAQGARLGGLWGQYQDAIGRVVDNIFDPLLAKLARGGSCPVRQKKARRGSRPKKLGKSPQASNEAALENERLKKRMEEARQRLEKMASRDPIVELLLAPQNGGILSSSACARIAPRLKAIAERWEAAPEGYVGWREKALEIAAAMEIAAQDPNVGLIISG